MKVLQLCPKPPLPAIDGGCMASYSLAGDMTAAGAELNILCMATEKHPFIQTAFNGKFKNPVGVGAIPLNTALSAGILASYVFSGSSNYRLRFFRKTFSIALRKHLSENEYDFIVFDGFKTAYYLPLCRALSNAKLIYRAHNAESKMLREEADSHNGILMSRLLRSDSARLEREERNIWNNADQVWCISETDRIFISSRSAANKRVLTIPFTMANYKTKVETIPLTVFHLGAMDWKPNVEGMKWFTGEVWPLVLRRISNASLHIGGREIGNVLRSDERLNITVHPDVQDSASFFARYQVMVIPLKKGGGIRVKLIQAMSMGKALVTTSKGCEGINGKYDVHYFVADEAGEMAEKICRLLTDEGLRKMLGEMAKGFYMENHSPDVAKALLLKAFNTDRVIES